MINKIKTVGEAVAYCKRFGLEISPVSDVLFETAAALHVAMEAGMAMGASSVSDNPIYIDGKGGRELINLLMQTAEEIGRDPSVLSINYLDGKAESNTYNPEHGK